MLDKPAELAHWIGVVTALRLSEEQRKAMVAARAVLRRMQTRTMQKVCMCDVIGIPGQA